MDENYKKSLTEVFEILNHTDVEIIEKIPESFIKFLRDNMDKDYIPIINFYEVNWENTLRQDTLSILALIYRDYIVSKEERKKLLVEEKNEEIEQERLKREKYNPDNLFKRKEKIPDEMKNETQLMVLQQQPWYKKVINKILKIFGIKNN